MTTIDHNRLLKNAAKSVLKPLGCVQKGTSRTWLDPHPLWVGVIEFQPSGWSKGSYLNVGACWLWYEKDFLSFDDGYRVEQFTPFESEQQFADAAMALAARAANEVGSLRARFGSLADIATHLKQTNFSSIWNNYHAAVAATLTGDLAHAAQRFAAIAADNHAAAWAVELRQRAAALERLAGDPARFQEAVSGIAERNWRHFKLGQKRS